MFSQDWIDFYLLLAKTVSKRSKDPSTKVGAVIVRPDKTVASVGFNGFPRGVKDTYERLNVRAVKHRLTIHAELNAILHAREPLHGYSLFVWPFQPCAQCAGAIIQSGIRTVYAPVPDSVSEPWLTDFEFARAMFREAGVELVEL